MLFTSFFGNRPTAGRTDRRTRRRGGATRHVPTHAPERLESRLPLAFNVTTTTLTSDDNGPLTFAYNITIDDQVDSNGLGRDIFLSRFDSGTPLIKVADNPSFNNATTLGILRGRAECTTIFVTSAGRQRSLFATSDLPSSNPNALPIAILGNRATFNLADKTNPSLQGINPLGISGIGTFDYTNPDGDSFTLSFTYEAGAIPAYGPGALTFRQVNADAWSDAGLAVPTGIVSTSFSSLTNDYVTSVSLQFTASSGNFGTLDTIDVTNAPYDYFDSAPANPQSFTVAQGQNLNQRLIVDLAAAGSRISINSSWFGALGDADGNVEGVDVDPSFYRGYDGVLGVGQLNLFASEVVFNQDVSSVNRIAIGGPANVFTRSGNLDPASATPNVVTGLSSLTNLIGGGRLFVTGPGIQPETTVVSVDSFAGSITLSKPPTLAQTNVSLTFISPRPSGYIRDTESLRVLANAQAPSFDIEVAGTQADHGEIFVSQAGSLRGTGGGPAGALAIAARSTDVRFEGTVSAASQGYFLSAPGATDQYVFTTRSASTGTQTGLISGGTVAFTLGQPGGGTVDLKTAIDNVRFDSGVNASGAPFRYAVAVEDGDNLIVDSVAASSGPIALVSATGSLAIKGAAVRTTGDLTATAATSLSFDGSVSSSNGNVTLVSPALALGSSVTAGGARGVSLQSKTGSSTINALVQAGGQLKAPVKVATNAPVDLVGGGLLTVDQVALLAGDRVLVKNQLRANENGIYVVSAGSWARAADANTSVLLAPGFVTFAIEGQTQKGGWVFQNPANPILGQTGTGLSFVPLTATLTFEPAKVATTGPIDLATVGLATIDGVPLAAGDRVLVKNQANLSENGIYVASVGPWLRASDSDTVAELRAGAYVFITGGAVNSGRGFALLNDAVQVGTTDLTFNAFAVENTRTNFWSPSHTLQPVRVATTVNLESLSGLQTIDGAQLLAGNRVLVKNQIAPSANGIYVAAAGAWARAADVMPGTDVPYDTFVFVNEGTVGRGTGWLVDNSAVMTATLAANSNLLTGLRSTEGLTIGMAVEGEGIPAGSTITGIGADGFSVFLSRNATTAATLSLVRFVNFANPTVGTTPLVFRAVGGNVSVASAGDISGSPTQGRLLGQNVVLTAGTGGTGRIDTKTTASTISAVAPGSISLDNASQVELSDVRSGTAADISVLSAGTLTATSLTAGRNATLSSTFGDVVAGRVRSVDGTITLSSLVSNTAIANAAGTARVAAENGSVVVRADRGAVIVNGQVAAQGVGSDVSFISNFVSSSSTDPAAVRFGPLADVAATDQLAIDAPNSMPSVDPAAKLTAARLSLRSKLFGNTAPPASLGSFPTVLINRTDSGNINYASLASLTVEGATTVNGSIAFSAPDLRVSGGIATVGATTDVTLTATADNLRIDGAVTAQRDINLNAPGGSITGNSGVRTALLTAPRTVNVAARTSAVLSTKAQSLQAQLTNANAVLDVADDDGVEVSSALLTAGGTVALKVGSPALGGATTIGLVNAGPSGTVSIDSFGDIVENTIDPAADIVARTLSLTSSNGRIALDTQADIVSASTLQKTAPITIKDIGTGATPLTLRSISGVGTGADVTITSPRTIVAESVATAGTIGLTTTTATADILLGVVTATGNTATINAGRSVGRNGATPLVTATSVVLDASAGSIDAALAASNVVAATNAGGGITLTDADSLSIGNDALARGISTTGPVSITVGGSLTQTQRIVAQSLTATGTGGTITLLNPTNDVDSLTANNGSRGVSFADVDDLRIDSMNGGALALSVGGALTQTGTIVGSSLAVTNASGPVTLTNAGNNVATLSGSASSGNFAFVNTNGFTVEAPGISAGTTAGGDGDINLTAQAGNIGIAANLTAANDTVRLAAPAGTITQTGGAITGRVLDWTANTAPTLPNTNASAFGVNLTGTGDISLGTPGQAITVASASAANGNVTITGSNVTIEGLVQAGGTAKPVQVDASGTILFQAAGRIVNADAGGTVTLNADGAISATNTATETTVTAGNSLTLSAGGATSLRTDVGSLAAAVTAGGLTVDENNGLAITSINAAGQAVALTTAGPLTQTGAIVGSSLAVTNTSGAVTLTNTGNNVTTLSGSASSGNFAFVDTNGFTVGAPGISAGTAAVGDGDINLTAQAGNIGIAANLTAANDTIRLSAPTGTITQTSGVITSRNLDWTANTTPAFTNTAVTAFSLNLTGPGDINFGTAGVPTTISSASTANGNVSIAGSSVTIDGLVQAGGSAKTVKVDAGTTILFQAAGRIVNADASGTVILNAGSGITATITSTETTVTAGNSLTLSAGGATSLSTEVGSLAAMVTSGGLTVNEKTGLAVTSINAAGQSISITAAGPLTQTGAIIGSSLAVTNTGGAVTLTNAGNQVNSLSANTGSAAFAFRDGTGTLLLDNVRTGPLTIAAAGTIFVNEAISGGAVVLSTVNGGGLIVSQRPNGLLKAATQLDVTGLEGTITLQNGGRIEAASLNANAGGGIKLSGIVATADELGRMVALINALPATSTPVYEIVVAGNIPLTTTLAINRPVILRGQTATATLSGGAGAANGIVLDTGASASQVTALAFSGFTGTALRLVNARNVVISGVTVRDSGPGGTGLEIRGASSGTTVTASRFTNLGTGIRLVGATGATIGSRINSDRNTISGATRAGVFASGICTRTQVIRTVFSGMPRRVPQFNIASSRNLRIVR